MLSANSDEILQMSDEEDARVLHCAVLPRTPSVGSMTGCDEAPEEKLHRKGAKLIYKAAMHGHCKILKPPRVIR